MNNKEKYREYCKAHSVALYQNDWWLDAVCGEKNWDVIGTFAFPFKKKYGLKLIQLPMLTLGLGPVGKTTEELTDFDLFDLNFLPGTNPDWKGFKQSKKLTYRIHDLSNIEKVFSKFSSSTRQQIRKAEKAVAVSESQDIEALYKMVSLTFKRQSKKTPYSLAYVKSINESCAKKNCRKILLAKDNEGNIHSACLIAWDKQTTYYVMGGADPKHKSSASYSLLMYSAIKEASKHSKEFDFCGSSIPSIERFFKGFSSEQVTYFQLKKVNSKALKLLLSLKGK